VAFRLVKFQAAAFAPKEIGGIRFLTSKITGSFRIILTFY
jgi:hypothetical protein